MQKTTISLAQALASACVWACFVSGEATAQTRIPGGAQPGQLKKPFQRPPAARPAPQVELKKPASPPPPAQPSDPRFEVKTLTVDGVTVLRAEAVEAITRTATGRVHTLEDIHKLADQLTALYRNEGYVLSQVVVPEQRVTDGAVRLVAVEGYVDQVRFSSPPPGSKGSALLEAYAQRIKASRPLKAEVLERYLLLMNDLAGSHARAIVRASATTPSASDLLIEFSSRSLDANAEVNNRGSRPLGEVQLQADISLHSPLLAFDDLRLTLATTPVGRFNLVSANYDLPLGSDGLLLKATATVARAKPLVEGISELRTESRSAQLGALYPIERSRSRNLYLRGNLSWLNGTTELDGLPLTQDRVRAIRLGLNFDLADRWLGVNLADAEFSQGLNIGGATQADAADSSRVGASPTFSKLSFYAARLQSLSPSFELLVALSGQYASAKLFPSEQYAFGGGTFGRAYDSGELLGDSGAAVKTELRFSRPTDFSLLRGYTLYVFHESGKVWLNDPVNQDSHLSASDAGLGARLNLYGQWSAYLEVAKPLTRTVVQENNRNARAFGAVRWTY